jgi:hypothetical protein
MRPDYYWREDTLSMSHTHLCSRGRKKFADILGHTQSHTLTNTRVHTCTHAHIVFFFMLYFIHLFAFVLYFIFLLLIFIYLISILFHFFLPLFSLRSPNPITISTFPFLFSLSFRAIRSSWILLQELNQIYRPAIKSWRLNERMYVHCDVL